MNVRFTTSNLKVTSFKHLSMVETTSDSLFAKKLWKFVLQLHWIGFRGEIAGNYVIEVLIFPVNDALDECRINFLSNLEVWSILMDFSMIDSTWS